MLTISECKRHVNCNVNELCTHVDGSGVNICINHSLLENDENLETIGKEIVWLLDFKGNVKRHKPIL